MEKDVRGVLRELCTAPLDAAVKAEADYRAIWLEWLEEKIRIVKSMEGVDLGDVWKKLFESAPAVSVNSRVDLAVTLRITSVKEFSAEGRIGLTVGPIYASGGFGFMSRTTTESTLQASTSVVLSNNEQNLLDYLGKHNIKSTDPNLPENAKKLLTGELPKS